MNDANPNSAHNLFMVGWSDGTGSIDLVFVVCPGKTGRRIGRGLHDATDDYYDGDLEFFGPGAKPIEPGGASDGGGSQEPGLWCIAPVWRAWEGENIEPADRRTGGGA